MTVTLITIKLRFVLEIKHTQLSLHTANLNNYAFFITTSLIFIKLKVVCVQLKNPRLAII